MAERRAGTDRSRTRQQARPEHGGGQLRLAGPAAQGGGGGIRPAGGVGPQDGPGRPGGSEVRQKALGGGHGRQDSQGELRGDGGDGKEEAVPQDGGDGQGRSRRQGGHDPPPGAGAAPVGAVG